MIQIVASSFGLDAKREQSYRVLERTRAFAISNTHLMKNV